MPLVPNAINNSHDDDLPDQPSEISSDVRSNQSKEREETEYDAVLDDSVQDKVFGSAVQETDPGFEKSGEQFEEMLKLQNKSKSIVSAEYQPQNRRMTEQNLPKSFSGI